MTTTLGILTVLHPVSDLAIAKAMYAALLGVQPQTDSPYYVGFEAEGRQIGLVPGGGPPRAPPSRSRCTMSGGRLVATCTDPDGNVLGLIQDQ